MVCINKSHPEIAKLLDEFKSETLVSKLLESFPEDKIPTVVEMRSTLANKTKPKDINSVESLLKESGAFRKLKGIWYIKWQRGTEARNLIGRLNGQNPGLLTINHEGFGQKGRTIESVDINPQLSIFNQRSKETPTVKPSEEKINALVESFKSVGIKVNIVEDNTIDSIARVDYKTGDKEATIRLKSEVLNDTLEHEGGHIYVDLLGVDSDIMKRFWKQIEKDHRDVIAHVKAEYKEFDYGSDQFKREAMAQVIGEEAAKQTPKKLSKIQIILNQIYRFFANLFGREPSIGKELARQMISGQLIVRKGETLKGEGGEQRSEKPITPLEYSKRTYINLSNQIKELSATVKPNTGTGTLDLYNNLISTLLPLSDLQRLSVINDFIQTQDSEIRRTIATRGRLDGFFLRNAMNFIKTYDGIDQIVDYKGTEWEHPVSVLRKSSLDIKDLRNLLLRKIKEHLLDFYKQYATNPEYVDDMAKILDSDTDLNFLSQWLEGLDKAPLPLFQLMDKVHKEIVYAAGFNGQKKIDEHNALVKELKDKGIINFDFALEEDSKGKHTGKFLREYKHEYFDRIEELNDIINAYDHTTNPEYQKIADKAREDLYKFFRENTYQETTEEFQNIFKILDRNPRAKERRDAINDAYNDILKKARLTKNEFSPHLLSPEDYDQLISLKEQKENLSSLIDPETGLPKEGDELEIAKIIKEFNKTIAEVYTSKFLKSKKEDFERSKQVAKDHGDEYYQKWKVINTVREISPSWYDEMSEVFSLLEGTEKSEISAINEEIRELSQDYKTKGGFIRAKMLYERNPELFKKIQALEKKKEQILKEKAKNSSKYLRPFEIPEEFKLAGNAAFYAQIERAKKQLTPLAKKWKDDFKNAVVAILSKYTKEGEKIYNSYEVTPEDLLKLLELKRAYKFNIGSDYDISELTKDQKSIIDYNNLLSIVSHYTDNKALEKKFTEDRRIALDRGDAYANLWDAWYGSNKEDIFNPMTDEFEGTAVSNGYTVSVPNDQFIDEKKTRAYKKLNELSTRVNSPDYEKAYSEAKSGSESDFNEWYRNNHYYDPISGKDVPYYIWTQSVPKDEKYIDNEAPSNHWRESDIKEEFKNPDFINHIDPNSPSDKPRGLPLESWKSDKYRTLMSLPDNDIRKRYFQWISGFINEIVADMGKNILQKGFIPTVYAGTDKTWKDYLKDIPSHLWYSNMSEFDKFEVSPALRLRVPFVQKLQKEYIKKDKAGNPEDLPEEILRKRKVNKEFHKNNINYNIGEVMSVFIQPMLRYKAKASIINEMLLSVDLFFNEANIAKGSGIRQLMSRKLMTAVGLEESPLSPVDPAESRLAHRIEDWLSLNFFEEGLVPWISKPNKDHKVIDYNKISRNLSRYTQLRALAFNVYAAATNVTLGQMQLRMEAASKLFFNRKNLVQGNIFYSKNLPYLLRDSVNVDKVSLAGKWMSLLASEHGEANGGFFLDEFGRLNKLGTINNAMMLPMRAGDHMLHTVLVGAMLDSHTIENGKIIRITKPKEQKSLLKLSEQLTGQQNLSATQIYEKLGITKEQLAKFKNKANNVFKSNNGVYDKESQPAAKRHALTAMAMMFRNFIAEGFLRRYQRETYSEEAEMSQVGYYRATITNKKAAMQYLVRLMEDITRIKTGLMLTEWDSLPEHYKAGIRATVVETALLFSIILAILLLGSGDDGDEKESYWHAFIRYLLNRLRADILFFHPEGIITGDVTKILRSPLVTMSTLTDAGNFIMQGMSYPFQAPEERVYQTGINKGKTKVLHSGEKLVPVANQIIRLQDPAAIASFYRIMNF